MAEPAPASKRRDGGLIYTGFCIIVHCNKNDGRMRVTDPVIPNAMSGRRRAKAAKTPAPLSRPIAAPMMSASAQSFAEAAMAPVHFTTHEPADHVEIAGEALVTEALVTEAPVIAAATTATAPQQIEVAPVKTAEPIAAPQPITASATGITDEPISSEPVSSVSVSSEPTSPEPTSLKLQGSETMATIIPPLPTEEKVKQMFGDASSRVKTMLEKSGKIGEDVVELTKGNVEAVVTSARVAAKGTEALGQDAAEYGKKSFESAVAIMKSYASAKSPTELFQLQSEYAKASFDSAVAEASKFSESMLRLFGEVAQPLSSRYAVAAEKIKAATL